MAKRAICRIGDPTSHGGTILEGFSTHTVYDKASAGIGHKVSCPLCKGTFVIVAGAAHTTYLGKNIAVEGMQTSCGAVLIATQNKATIDVESGSSTEKKKKTTDTTLAKTGIAKKVEFDEQIRFFWQDRNVMADTRYTLTLADGSTVSGTTDAAGKTQRIETTTEQAIISAEIFPEQIFCCANHAEQLSALGGQAPTPKSLSMILAMRGIGTNSSEIGSSIVQHTIVPESSRYLTMGEIEMAKLVFKNSIDYNKVKVHKGGLFGIPSKQNTAITPNGEIHFPEQAYEDDFSTVSDNLKIWFIHELAHVWQYQLGYKVVFYANDIALRGGYTNDGKAGPAPAYRYDLNGVDANKTMPQFNMEQQAELISHYFDALTLSGSGNSVAHERNQAKIKRLGTALGSFRREPKDPSLLPITSAVRP